MILRWKTAQEVQALRELNPSVSPWRIVGVQAVVGFLDRGMAEIAGYLEAYFGAAFYLSESEKTFLLNKLTQKVMNDLRS